MNDEFHRSKLAALKSCLFFIYSERADATAKSRMFFSNSVKLLFLLFLYDVVSKHPFLSTKRD